MNSVEMVCIKCPVGCKLKILMDENNKIEEITGFKCPRGKEYAIQEILNPKRIIPTNVKVLNGDLEIVSVKTSCEIPKEKISEIMGFVKTLKVEAPVNIGQVIAKNILGTEADLVATKNIKRKEL